MDPVELEAGTLLLLLPFIPPLLIRLDLGGAGLDLRSACSPCMSTNGLERCLDDAIAAERGVLICTIAPLLLLARAY